MTHTHLTHPLTDTLTDPLWLSHHPLPCLLIPYKSFTCYLNCHIDTLAPMYISQPSGYLVASVLTRLPSRTFCAITSWILPDHPLCATALFIATCSFLESLRALFTEHPLLT